MVNWSEILDNIPEGTYEKDFEDRFVSPFLETLGFPSNYREHDTKQLSGEFRGKPCSCRPDYICYRESEPQVPFLIVEDKAVKPSLWNDAVNQVQKAMIIASGDERYKDYLSRFQFGIATNGIFLQLFQRHGKICVPRTPVLDLRKESIPKIIDRLKLEFSNPRKALTAMFWNNKGGVGKTTITAYMGASLAAKPNTKVLLINFDLQGDLNCLFGLPYLTKYKNQHNITMYDALYDISTGIHEVDYKKLIALEEPAGKKQGSKLAIIPGDLSMFEVEASDLAPNREILLKLLLEKAGFYSEYDYIFIDTSPSWRGIGELAAYASDILIPVITDFFSVIATVRIKEIFLNADTEGGGKWQSHSAILPPKLHGYLTNACNKKDLTEDNIEKWLNEGEIPKELGKIDCSHLAHINFYERIKYAGEKRIHLNNFFHQRKSANTSERSYYQCFKKRSDDIF